MAKNLLFLPDIHLQLLSRLCGATPFLGAGTPVSPHRGEHRTRRWERGERGAGDAGCWCAIRK